MLIEANAKVNLTLDVVRRRDDGYHELNMIMVPLTLSDTLDITISDKDELICKSMDMPMNDSNTIVKAIKLMRETYGISECFRVEVIKRIPMEAGMAGGSADAGATMKAINRLCNLNVSLEELAMLSKKVGADVPFCIMNTCSLVKGIGEFVTPFEIKDKIYILLVKPKEGVSTKLAFESLDFNTCIHPDTDKCKEYLENGDYEMFCKTSGNTLEQSAFMITPVIKEIKEKLLEYNFDFVLMSGSGSTVFAITKDKNLVEKANFELKDTYDFVYSCEIWNG